MSLPILATLTVGAGVVVAGAGRGGAGRGGAGRGGAGRGGAGRGGVVVLLVYGSYKLHKLLQRKRLWNRRETASMKHGLICNP